MCSLAKTISFRYHRTRSFDSSATVIVSEPALLRRQQALEHGATQALDPLNTDIAGVVAEATGGLGVDIVFDAAGVQASIDAALHSVRRRGSIVNVAIWEKNANVNMNMIVMKEITLTGKDYFPPKDRFP